jgi:hypothetical protein
MDHFDADLLLRLYELRREEKLRRARQWMIEKFQVDSIEERVLSHDSKLLGHGCFPCEPRPA